MDVQAGPSARHDSRQHQVRQYDRLILKFSQSIRLLRGCRSMGLIRSICFQQPGVKDYGHEHLPCR